MQATRIAKGGGADEALLVRPDGIVLEAPTSTIFWVSGDELRTPALHVGILDSITRSAVIGGAARRPQGSSRSRTCWAPARRSWPPPSARSSPSRGSTSVSFEPGPRAADARDALMRAVAAELGTEAVR